MGVIFCIMPLFKKKIPEQGRGFKSAAGAMLQSVFPRRHSGPGYSRVSTAENDDFALADQLLADDEEVEPSNI